MNLSVKQESEAIAGIRTRNQTHWQFAFTRFVSQALRETWNGSINKLQRRRCQGPVEGSSENEQIFRGLRG
jgi:hypothetical protein